MARDLLDPPSTSGTDPHPLDHPPVSFAPSFLDSLPPGVQAVVERARDRVGRFVVLLVVLAAVAFAAFSWLRPGAAPVEQQLPLAAAGAGAATAASGPASGSPDGTGPTGTDAAAASTSTSAPTLTVQASGAVARPGVYDLPAGARVDDLVRAAGGLTGEADPDRTNLAAPLADGERVWIPRRTDLAVPEVLAGGRGSSGGGASAASGPDAAGAGPTEPSGPIDLNTASAEELDRLPGVGPATASAILAYREEHGRFSSVDELLDVRGIGEAKLEALRDAVTV